MPVVRGPGPGALLHSARGAACAWRRRTPRHAGRHHRDGALAMDHADHQRPPRVPVVMGSMARGSAVDALPVGTHRAWTQCSSSGPLRSPPVPASRRGCGRQRARWDWEPACLRWVNVHINEIETVPIPGNSLSVVSTAQAAWRPGFLGEGQAKQEVFKYMVTPWPSSQ